MLAFYGCTHTTNIKVDLLLRKTILVVRKKITYLEFLFFSSDNLRNLCYVIECWTEAWIPSKNTIAKYPKCCQWSSKLSVNINNFVNFYLQHWLLHYQHHLLMSHPKNSKKQLLLSSSTELSQTSASVSVSFADPLQGWETVFEVHLRSQLPKVI